MFAKIVMLSDLADMVHGFRYPWKEATIQTAKSTETGKSVTCVQL